MRKDRAEFYAKYDFLFVGQPVRKEPAYLEAYSRLYEQAEKESALSKEEPND